MTRIFRWSVAAIAGFTGLAVFLVPPNGELLSRAATPEGLFMVGGVFVGPAVAGALCLGCFGHRGIGGLAGATLGGGLATVTGAALLAAVFVLFPMVLGLARGEGDLGALFGGAALASTFATLTVFHFIAAEPARLCAWAAGVLAMHVAARFGRRNDPLPPSL